MAKRLTRFRRKLYRGWHGPFCLPQPSSSLPTGMLFTFEPSPQHSPLVWRSLLLYRQLWQFAWARLLHDSEARRILLVGAGPAGRSIGRALRNDPFALAVVRGFLDDDLPLSPDVIGRVDDLDWLARGEFIDEIILALPGPP